jgi:hypothetical protein
MTEEPEHDIRIQALLGELAQGGPERDGPAVTRRVVRDARWQRPLRRGLVAAGEILGAVGDLSVLVLGGDPRRERRR